MIRTQRILMLGVDDATAARLSQALSPLKHAVQLVRDRSVDKGLAAIEKFRPHVLCLPADSDFHTALRRSFTSRGLTLPFVVVSHKGEPREWRAALQAGAADYFSAPFEMSKVQQVFAGAVTSPMTSFLALQPS